MLAAPPSVSLCSIKDDASTVSSDDLRACRMHSYSSVPRMPYSLLYCLCSIKDDASTVSSDDLSEEAFEEAEAAQEGALSRFHGHSTSKVRGDHRWMGASAARLCLKQGLCATRVAHVRTAPCLRFAPQSSMLLPDT